MIIIDPGSKAGTKIDDAMISQNVPYTLKNNQTIIFGESSRSYKVSLDYSKVSKSFELEKNKLEQDLKILENLEGEDLDLETLQKSLGLNKNDTVWVGNLIPSTTEEDLRDIFEDCGKIKSIRIPEDRATRQGKGFAFITFTDDKGAKNAQARDGIPFYKKFLKVSIAESRPDLKSRNDRPNEEVKTNSRRRSRDRDRRSNSRDSRHRRRPNHNRGRRGSVETYEEYKRRKHGRGGKNDKKSSHSGNSSPSSKSSHSSSSPISKRSKSGSSKSSKISH